MTTKISRRVAAVAKAVAALIAELKREYPEGTKVIYRLRGGADAHRYPEQQGTVVGHTDDGRLRVELAQSRGAKATGLDRLYVTSLPASKIIRKVKP